MSISNQQYMDRLTEISKDFGKDQRLPEAARQLFSKALDLAETRRYDSIAAECNPLEETFAVLCEACKAAGLRQCEKGHDGFLACQLVWNYSS